MIYKTIKTDNSKGLNIVKELVSKGWTIKEMQFDYIQLVYNSVLFN